MPLVSVVTTVFNCERYILESLESIAAQTYQNFEWLIINDGSTDKTWEIVSSFKHPNIVLVNNQDNKRIPTRRNEAIEMARGDLIAIHDGDDLSLPNRLKMQVEHLRENQDLFCLGGWAIRIDEHGNEGGIMSYPPTKPSESVKLLLHKRTNPIIDPTCMFRRSIFIKLGRYTLEKMIYTVPDMDLWARAIVSGYGLMSLPLPLIKYRINPDGMTRKHNAEMLGAHRAVWQRFYHELNKSRKSGTALRG